MGTQVSSRDMGSGVYLELLEDMVNLGEYSEFSVVEDARAWRGEREIQPTSAQG